MLQPLRSRRLLMLQPLRAATPLDPYHHPMNHPMLLDLLLILQICTAQVKMYFKTA
jgi:hypothetical protein